jgi:hypothetical protein
VLSRNENRRLNGGAISLIGSVDLIEERDASALTPTFV